MEELKRIIEKHEKWLKSQEGGECADLRGANLSEADLRGADLFRASLRGADLSGADMRGVDLRGADMRETDLSGADLRGADLRGVDLREADLRGADLSGADLYGSDLRGAKYIPFIPMTCPDSGSFTAWKKAHGHILKLLIPEDARRSSATGRKCRCDKAVVVAIEKASGEPAELVEIASDYDENFIYRIGEAVSVSDFCEDRFTECAAGIHFFINRQEAVEYN